MKKTIEDIKFDKTILKSDLLAHVLGGIGESGRCEDPRSHYNDTTYVKPPTIPPHQ